jgi:hypothetical protein
VDSVSVCFGADPHRATPRTLAKACATTFSALRWYLGSDPHAPARFRPWKRRIPHLDLDPATSRRSSLPFKAITHVSDADTQVVHVCAMCTHTGSSFGSGSRRTEEPRERQKGGITYSSDPRRIVLASPMKQLTQATYMLTSTFTSHSRPKCSHDLLKRTPRCGRRGPPFEVYIQQPPGSNSNFHPLLSQLELISI